MTKNIITISREFGSGGRFIGELLAKELGFSFLIRKSLNRLLKKQDSPKNLFPNVGNMLLKRIFFPIHFLEEICRELLWRITFIRLNAILFMILPKRETASSWEDVLILF